MVGGGVVTGMREEPLATLSLVTISYIVLIVRNILKYDNLSLNILGGDLNEEPYNDGSGVAWVPVASSLTVALPTHPPTTRP